MMELFELLLGLFMGIVLLISVVGSLANMYKQRRYNNG